MTEKTKVTVIPEFDVVDVPFGDLSAGTFFRWKLGDELCFTIDRGQYVWITMNSGCISRPSETSLTIPIRALTIKMEEE